MTATSLPTEYFYLVCIFLVHRISPSCGSYLIGRTIRRAIDLWAFGQEEILELVPSALGSVSYIRFCNDGEFLETVDPVLL